MCASCPCVLLWPCIRVCVCVHVHPVVRWKSLPCGASKPCDQCICSLLTYNMTMTEMTILPACLLYKKTQHLFHLIHTIDHAYNKAPNLESKILELRSWHPPRKKTPWHLDGEFCRSKRHCKKNQVVCKWSTQSQITRFPKSTIKSSIDITET